MLCDCWLKSAADHNGHAKRASGQAHAELILWQILWAKLIGLYFGGAWTMKMTVLGPTQQPPSLEQKVSVSPIILQSMSPLMADFVAEVG
jgi:hypothetical protein